jgi:hypothetical protein
MPYTIALLALGAGVPAVAAPPLAKNPFVRPQLAEQLVTVAGNVDEPLPPLELRAVLVAGAASSVNVGGRIVRVGEQYDGYELISVSEDGAVFGQADRRLHVPLQAQRAPEAVAEAVDDE